MDGFNDKLDPIDQVDTEEAIAAYLFDSCGIRNEELVADMGRDILLIVLRKFRPDLCLPVK